MLSPPATRNIPSFTTIIEHVRSDKEEMLRDLLDGRLVLEEDWEALAPAAQEDVLATTDERDFLDGLVRHGLLNNYQASRIEAGTTFGMILGNYRVLDRIGAGGMGVVFRAEHIRLRRQVAIKVLPMDADQPPNLLLRFYSEVRAIAQLVHPNIVAAIDAGELAPPRSSGQTLHYLVMEYVPGQDLEEYVLDRGPLPVAVACDIAQQVADALAEANRHGIVHRDIKPSNILVTPEGVAKLLDFGLTRSMNNRLTEPGSLLGTIDFMAPEQVQDASSVDIRADLYGLGGTVYWCLTGQLPFPPQKNLAEELARRLTQQAPSAAVLRPEIPRELDALVRRMMAIKPDDRHSTPEAVRHAFLPWVTNGRHLPLALHEASDPSLAASLPRQLNSTQSIPEHPAQVLVVDDEPAPRDICCRVLRAAGIECDEANGGLSALEAIRGKPYDLVLTDVHMPDFGGLELCRQLRQKPPAPHLKIITMSGLANPDDLANMLLAGADDFLSKPFSVVQLQARVKASLRLKSAQDRSDRLNKHLLALNDELQQNLRTSDSSLIDTRNALVLTLARMVEQREGLGTMRLTRLQMYMRLLCEEASRYPAFAGRITAEFIDQLSCAAPLLDIGKVGLPDHILLKPGQLTSDERFIMQTHTTIGSDLLQSVAGGHQGSAQSFLRMAIDVARHHHERWDGTGYPDRLKADAIPLAARIVSPCDIYDALRSRRLYRPGLAHHAVLQVMSATWDAQLDPSLREPFLQCGDQMAKIFREIGE